MDERVGRLKTSKEAKEFARNASRLGRPDLEEQANRRAHQLRAIEEGYASPAQVAIAEALYVYEDQQSVLKGKTFRANRTRQMLDRHGPLAAAERMVLSPRPSKGFEVLEEAGLQALSFEAIIDRFPEEFSAEAVAAARARLGIAPQAEAVPSAGEHVVAPIARDVQARRAVAKPVPDGYALSILSGFSNPNAPYRTQWLPRYRAATEAISLSIASSEPREAFDLLWMTQENGISNAGKGMLSFQEVDRLRDDLLQVLEEIYSDGSPSCFISIIERLEGWKEEGKLKKVPRLLVARAFAGIHPGSFHTTVDARSHNEALDWFTAHTGFEQPEATDWATRAKALTEHLDQLELIPRDIHLRNVFPWFVVDQLRATKPLMPKPAGFRPRPTSTYADLPAERRRILLRHNQVQEKLYNLLAAEHGHENVWTEQPTGTGGYADALVRTPRHRYFLYEIKIGKTAADVVRQAMGQLLEYGFRSNGLEPERLFVVGEPDLDDETRRFLKRLKAEFNLDIHYLQIALLGN
ncbi:MAG: hypothetical protein O9303_00075 [Silanimonas sp.]|jgi:hypothetical protein|nr:hypothetical protein [Silanimonas sp.]